MKKLILLTALLSISISAAAQQKPLSDNETTLVFVRHAEKLADGTKDPSLSEIGKKRADKLAELLITDYEISAIYSTGYKRTIETSAPISQRLNIPIQEYQLNNSDSLISAMIEQNKGKQVLIVGHSNTTPDLVNIAMGEKLFEKLDESVFDIIFDVTIDGEGNGTIYRFTYWSQGRE